MSLPTTLIPVAASSSRTRSINWVPRPPARCSGSMAGPEDLGGIGTASLDYRKPENAGIITYDPAAMESEVSADLVRHIDGEELRKPADDVLTCLHVCEGRGPDLGGGHTMSISH